MLDTKHSRFTVSSGRICVTDPIYNERTPTDKVIVNGGHLGLFDVPAKNGSWRVEVRYYDAGERWGERIAEFLTYQVEQTLDGTLTPSRMSFGVGVDSGYAGVFDASEYTKQSDDSGQFPEPLRQALNEDKDFGSTVYGAFCQSGIGDGVYPVYAKVVDGITVAIRIDFTVHPLLTR